jgi:soluble lytic murein transglycosylase-like protein
MIDAMFQAGTDQALNDQVQRPRPAPPRQAPGFWAGSLTAPFRGVGAGAAESIAFGAEITGAFGDVLSATGAGGAGGMFSTQSEQERKDSEAARRRMLDSQTPYSNEAGDLFRARAAEIMPNPETTGTAGNLLAGLIKFGTKAIAYTAGGNPFGTLGLGLDEAFTESDRLKQQGVDLPTRAKAGAVAGVVAGGSVAVPLTGATAWGRFIKGTIVGEASVVAQAAAEKAILAHAGYDKLASTFDPFDPVALAVGLVPGALGARFGHATTRPGAAGAKLIDQMGLAERQALPYGDTRLDAYTVAAAQREGIPAEALLAIKNAGEKSGSTATSPAGARGVMQFMPETWKRYGKGDIADPMNSIDAGAKYMADLLKQYDGDVRAAIAHYNGGTKAGRAVREGGAPPAAETLAYLQRTDRYMAEQHGEQAGRINADDPDLQAAARVRQVADAIDESRLTPDDDLPGMAAHQDAIEQAHEQLAAGESVSVADIVSHDFQDTTPLVHPVDGEPVPRVQAMGERVQQFAAAADEMRAAARPPEPKPGPAAAAETQRAAPRPPTAQSQVDQPGPSQAHLDMAAAEVMSLHPDLLVHLDGMDAPARVGDLLASIREEAAHDAKTARLVEVAAACALRA